MTDEFFEGLPPPKAGKTALKVPYDASNGLWVNVVQFVLEDPDAPKEDKGDGYGFRPKRIVRVNVVKNERSQGRLCVFFETYIPHPQGEPGYVPELFLGVPFRDLIFALPHKLRKTILK
jgi:hypothetical protein